MVQIHTDPYMGPYMDPYTDPYGLGLAVMVQIHMDLYTDPYTKSRYEPRHILDVFRVEALSELFQSVEQRERMQLLPLGLGSDYGSVYGSVCIRRGCGTSMSLSSRGLSSSLSSSSALLT